MRQAWIIVLLSLAPLPALAQSVHLDHYRAAETPEDGFAASRPVDFGHLRFGARLDLDYGFDPLVYERTFGDASSEEAAVVEHLLAAQVGVSLGLFDRLVIYAGIVTNLVMQGVAVPGQPDADGASVGDVRLALRGRLFGELADVFQLALQLGLTLPTAQGVNAEVRFAGEDGLTLHPELLAELRPGAGIRVDVNVGARVRTTDRARFDTGGLVVSHELTWVLAVTVPVVESVVEIAVEAWGSTPFESFGDRNASPVEALLGAHVRPIEGLSLGLAGGLGLARGYGAPDFRGVLTVGWTDRTTSALREPLAARDGDSDADSMPDSTSDPASGSDSTADSTSGSTTDSTSGADSSADSLRDRDRDGVPDERDGAPTDPEDLDGFEDDDGVPDPDNDSDGVLDIDDGCPIAPGSLTEHGCPRTIRVDAETGQIFILQRVEFETNRTEILAETHEVLGEVRAVLASNPQILSIRIEGHTDNRGRDASNLDLSTRRAAAVIAWLVDHGVAPERLTGVGCGETHALETNQASDGRRSNRRVEFHILDPLPPSGPRALEGCREVAP